MLSKLPGLSIPLPLSNPVDQHSRLKYNRLLSHGHHVMLDRIVLFICTSEFWYNLGFLLALGPVDPATSLQCCKALPNLFFRIYMIWCQCVSVSFLCYLGLVMGNLWWFSIAPGDLKIHAVEIFDNALVKTRAVILVFMIYWIDLLSLLCRKCFCHAVLPRKEKTIDTILSQELTSILS